MPEKPTKPGLKRAEPSKAAPGFRKRLKARASPSGEAVRLGDVLSIKELAGQAGLSLTGPRAKVGLKKIQKAGGGAVLIKERDLLALLRAGAPPQHPSAGGAAKAVNASPRQSPPVISERETELLGRINAGLSEPQARRLESLDTRRKEEALTPEEHAELLSLVDKSERLAAVRAEALVELARLRGVEVPSLMRDLGLGFTAGG
jgi:hypothetical protein